MLSPLLYFYNLNWHSFAALYQDPHGIVDTNSNKIEKNRVTYRLYLGIVRSNHKKIILLLRRSALPT